MVERNGYADGEPCWTDVTAPDLEAAKRFYAAVFDWTFEDTGADFGNYNLCFLDGKMVAAVSPPMQDMADAPAAWSLYLWSEDLDGTARRVEQGGGKLLMGPMEIPGSGRMLFGFDPTDAAFGVWEPGQHRGAQVFGETGALSWAELNTRDGAAADAFYRGLFGYEQEQIGDGETFDYTVWKVGGAQVCGRLQMTAEWGELPPHWMVYFGVDDTDAAAQRVAANGGQVRHGPFDSPYGRIVVVADPNGAVLSLIDPSRAVPAQPPAA